MILGRVIANSMLQTQADTLPDRPSRKLIEKQPNPQKRLLLNYLLSQVER